MDIRTVWDNGDLIVRFKNAQDYIDVLSKIFELEKTPEVNLAPLPAEETKNEFEVSEKAELIEFLKENKECEIYHSFILDIAKKYHLSESDFFKGVNLDAIKEAYNLIKDYEQAF